MEVKGVGSEVQQLVPIGRRVNDALGVETGERYSRSKWWEKRYGR